MNIAVFCASSEQIGEVYFQEARLLGECIAKQAGGLVYGGTNCGLMREVAEATLQNGGTTLGIIPECIRKKGVVARKVSQLLIAPDMKERKKMMREYADAFIALPGGWGTLEEITEVITLKQLGFHNKPVVFLNTNGYYTPFLDFIRSSRKEGFISFVYDSLYKVADSVKDAMQYILSYRPEEITDKYKKEDKYPL